MSPHTGTTSEDTARPPDGSAWAAGATPTRPPTTSIASPARPPAYPPVGDEPQRHGNGIPSPIPRFDRPESLSASPAGTSPTPPAGLPPLAPAPSSPPGQSVGNNGAPARSRRLRSALAIATGSFVLGGAVGAAGFAVGQRSVDSEPTVAPVAVTPVSTASEDPVSPAPPIVTNGEEPAAAVAQAVGPSVVQVETDLGSGSGVVYADGLILTNYHVIDNTNRIRVRSADGRVFEVELLGGDARNDIAVLSAPGADLPVAALGSIADLEVGQLTVAIGSPFLLQQTVTSGIVSSINRPVPNVADSYTAMIQTDAPINPGNSGGALANRAGEVVGINASIRTDGTSNSNVGIGFAIPIDTAVQVADRIVSGQSLEPGLLGVRGEVQDDGIGVPIASVVDGSAADAAGLQPGDRIITVDGAPVTSIDEVIGLIQGNFSGDTVELEVGRAGGDVTLSATLD